MISWEVLEMRKNKFSSAADRRWQRRYERIQQRKEEERERRDRQGRDEESFEYLHNQYISAFDISPPASVPTYTVTIPAFDEPNRNGTVIPRDTWQTAMEEYAETTVDTTQRSIADSILRIAYGDADESDRERVVTYIREALEGRHYEQPSRFDQVREAFKRYTESWFDSFVDVKDVPFGDRAIFGVDLAGGAEIPEPDLDAGDNSALDSFLGEFLAPGA